MRLLREHGRVRCGGRNLLFQAGPRTQQPSLRFPQLGIMLQTLKNSEYGSAEEKSKGTYSQLSGLTFISMAKTMSRNQTPSLESQTAPQGNYLGVIGGLYNITPPTVLGLWGLCVEIKNAAKFHHTRQTLFILPTVDIHQYCCCKFTVSLTYWRGLCSSMSLLPQQLLWPHISQTVLLPEPPDGRRVRPTLPVCRPGRHEMVFLLRTRSQFIPCEICHDKVQGDG